MRLELIIILFFILVFSKPFILAVDLVKLSEYPNWVLIEHPDYNLTWEERMNWEVWADPLELWSYRVKIGDKNLLLFASANFLGNETFNLTVKVFKPKWVLIIPYPYNDTTVLEAIKDSLYLRDEFGVNVSIWIDPTKLEDKELVYEKIREHGLVAHFDEPFLWEALNYPGAKGVEVYNVHSIRTLFKLNNVSYVITGDNDVGSLLKRLEGLKGYGFEVYVFAVFSREYLVTLWDCYGYQFTRCYGGEFLEDQAFWLAKVLVRIYRDFVGI